MSFKELGYCRHQSSMGRDNVNHICLTQALYIMYANIIVLYKNSLANLKHSNPSYEPDLFKESFETVYNRPTESF